MDLQKTEIVRTNQTTNKTTRFQYVLINERVKYFRANFSNYAMLSDIIEISEKRVVIKARIYNDKQIEVANGLACEISGDGFINQGSYIENCETSAWGRALANFGIGIDEHVCSADEILNKEKNSNNKLSEVQHKNIQTNNAIVNSQPLPVSDLIKNRINISNDLQGLTTIYNQFKNNTSIDQSEFNSLLSNRKKILNKNK